VDYPADLPRTGRPNSRGTSGRIQRNTQPYAVHTVSFCAARPIEVGIYDTRGRKVRTLYSGEVPGRILRLHWDGCGEDGNPVAQSIYFCKVRMGDMALTRKLTRIQ
jgi:hypothetical protein